MAAKIQLKLTGFNWAMIADVALLNASKFCGFYLTFFFLLLLLDLHKEIFVSIYSYWRCGETGLMLTPTSRASKSRPEAILLIILLFHPRMQSFSHILLKCTFCVTGAGGGSEVCI